MNTVFPLPPDYKGVARRLSDFFEANPGEELTKTDIMRKFDATESAVDQALWKLKANGVVTRSIVYRSAKED